jgi:hypothetical protein
VSKIQQTCKPDSELLLCARRVICTDSLPSEFTQCEEANSQAKPGMCSWPHCGLFGAYLCMYHEEKTNNYFVARVMHLQSRVS